MIILCTYLGCMIFSNVLSKDRTSSPRKTRKNLVIHTLLPSNEASAIFFFTSIDILLGRYMVFLTLHSVLLFRSDIFYIRRKPSANSSSYFSSSSFFLHNTTFIFCLFFPFCLEFLEVLSSSALLN